MVSPLLALGSILKCAFPFDVKPGNPGPSPHYCLYVDHFTMADGKALVSCIYGTSKLDQALIGRHHGLIMSVDVQQHIKITQGQLAGTSIHFVCDHVALMPCTDDWFYNGFQARLKFRDQTDSNIRQREQAVRLATVVRVAKQQTFLSIRHAAETGEFGLMPGKTLR